KAFLSMFPLILGLLAVVGLLLRDQHLQAQVQAMVLGFFPADAHAALQHTMDSVRKRSGVLGLISILGLLWSGGSLFITLEFVLGKILGTQQRGFLRQRGMAFSMTAIFVVVVVLSVFANALAGFVKSVPYVGPVVGAIIWIGFMLSIYRLVPNRTFKLGAIWRGA